MASITRESNGRRTIQFVGSDGKRRSIRLGKCSQKTAEEVRVKVEHLAAAVNHGTALDDETARWVADRDFVMYERLTAVGLVEPKLDKKHPLHVIVAWLGNSAPIAARHYLQVTDSDFDQATGGYPCTEGGAESGALAVQNPVQQPSGDSGKPWQETTKAPENQGLLQKSPSVYKGLLNTARMRLVPPGGVVM